MHGLGKCFSHLMAASTNVPNQGDITWEVGIVN
jgi:hypothetical protein